MINVVDSMCGTGKSTKMFEKMRKIFERDDTRKFLYITPFLSEIEERVPTVLPELQFKCPKNTGDGKVESLKGLVGSGENIASTHVLFSVLTPEIVDMLIDKQYVLVIDEALGCVNAYSRNITPDDVHALLHSNMVIPDVDNRNQLSWNEEEYPEHEGKYRDVRLLCNLGVLFSYDEDFLIYEYPPKLLRGLDDVYVLTYMFNGSDMRCWLDLHNIEYRYVPQEEFGLLPHREVMLRVKENLTILDNNTLSNMGQNRWSLSKAWFSNAKKPTLDKYKGIMRTAVNSTKSKNSDVFWTTYKDYRSKLEGKGYTKGVSPEMPCFLPLNTRAINDYKDYSLCMYAARLNKHPVEKRYLSEYGVSVDEDMFALSEMIQFIWRGCIRQYKPMSVLILNKRLRKDLEDWIEEGVSE